MCSGSDFVDMRSVHERRNALRADVTIDAELRKAGRTPFKITITDLSRTGCRADTLAKTYPGDTMYVSLPGLAPIAGVIRWATSRGFGIEWTAPLHPSVFVTNTT